MRLRLTLSNFRCFSEEQPAVFEIGPGFTGFIGPNNAGKSTVLKFFYEVRSAFSLLPAGRIPDLLGGAKLAGNVPPPNTDPAEIVYERARGPMQFRVDVLDAPARQGLYVKSGIWTYSAEAVNWGVELISSDDRPLSSAPNTRNVIGVDAAAQTCVLSDQTKVSYSEMIQAAAALMNIQYLGPFRNAVNEGAGDYFDLKLGTSFLAQWHQWKTGGNKQQNRAIGRVTEDVRRLMGVQSLEINASTELKTLQIAIDGRPHKLTELGAGIAQLIVVLGNALVRGADFIAIDEPETHLHPSLQLDFLTTLASYATRGVLYGTHSIGLARSTADRLYSVRVTGNSSSLRQFDRTPQYAEFLGSMGIAGLQDLGWDRILLVEGTSDVRVFQMFLRLYQLDRRVIVLPLGGSSLINPGTARHLEEILRFGARVYAVVDSERSAAGEALRADRRGFQENCMRLGIYCLVTERRATENYISNEAVRQAFGQGFASLTEFERLGQHRLSWGKTETWRAAQHMNRAELDATDLGAFLSSIAAL